MVTMPAKNRRILPKSAEVIFAQPTLGSSHLVMEAACTGAQFTNAHMAGKVGVGRNRRMRRKHRGEGRADLVTAGEIATFVYCPEA